jgi:hypothetical protein
MVPPLLLQLWANRDGVEGSQTSKNPMLTLTGWLFMSNEMLPNIEPLGTYAPIGGGLTSATNWSLYQCGGTRAQ